MVNCRRASAASLYPQPCPPVLSSPGSFITWLLASMAPRRDASTAVMRRRAWPNARLTSSAESLCRGALRDVDPDAAIAKVAPLQHVVDSAVERRRYRRCSSLRLARQRSSSPSSASTRPQRTACRAVGGNSTSGLRSARAPPRYSRWWLARARRRSGSGGPLSRWRAGNGRRHHAPTNRPHRASRGASSHCLPGAACNRRLHRNSLRVVSVQLRSSVLKSVASVTS